MLETIAVRNFKLLKDQVFQINNLNVFSGLNGSGKSTLIQSLLLLRQSFEKNMLPGKGLSLSGSYVRLGTGSDVLSVDAENELIEYDFFWENDTSLLLSFQYNGRSNLQPTVKEHLVGDCYEQSLFTSSFQYLSAERISPGSSFDVSDYDINNLNSIGNKGEYTAHFIAERALDIIHIKEIIHPAATSDTLIASIDAWMSEITPGTRVIAIVIPEINQASLRYEFETSSKVTKSFLPENTGFGLTYVLPIITSVLKAKRGDLLIIENPESHLHPAGQTAIAKLITLASENGVQIIIETHSDHFLNGVRISLKRHLISPSHVEFYFLSRDVESKEHCTQVENPRVDESGNFDCWPIGFFDEWDNSLDALLCDE